MQSTYLPLIGLYNLYFNNKLSEIIKINNTDPIYQSPIKIKNELPKLTPISKLLYESATEEDKIKLLQLFKYDDERIKELNKYNPEEDPDYLEKLENNGLGFYMENFICYYALCPICKQNTLKKFASHNMPVVDVVCTNKKYHLENNTCFLFQIKISLNESYFSKKNKFITIGSKFFGYNSHVIKSNFPIQNKLVCVGYICLSLDLVSNYDTKYKINNQKSFALVPDLQKQDNEYYYSYVNETTNIKNKITWNNKLVELTGTKDFLTNIEIDTNEIFFENVKNNPYNDLPEIFFGTEIQNLVKNKRKPKNLLNHKKYKLKKN